jgi:nitrite reductase (NADH) small subunit
VCLLAAARSASNSTADGSQHSAKATAEFARLGQPEAAVPTWSGLMHFVKLTTQSEIPAEGEAREFTLGDKVICVANVNGTISAMDNVCLHRGGPLGQGVIEGDKLVCPWHGWQWDPKTGQAAHNAAAKVAVYPLKIENGEVFVDVAL